MKVEDKTLAAIRAHAAEEYDNGKRESCGFVQIFKGRERYVPCENLAATPDEHFRFPAQAIIDAENEGDVVAVVHSHPDEAPEPSEADMVMCEADGIPWLIVNQPVGHYLIYEPQGYVAPLVGRRFVHGILDCLTLIQDYYQRELGISMPDFDRDDEWWKKEESAEGSNMYMDHYAECGFELFDQFEPVQVHDVILMQFDAKRPNHGAVYVGDNKILHHYYGRLSGHDVYGSQWRTNTRYILRHRQVSA